MRTEKIMKLIENLPNGRFFRMKYLSEVPVKEAYRKKGVAIFKIVETTTRTGIRYEKIKGVTLNESSTSRTTSNNWEWVIKNKIKYNTNTKKNYFVIAPIKEGANTKSYYIASIEGIPEVITDGTELKEYIIDSYWTKELNRPINTISLDHVLAIM